MSERPITEHIKELIKQAKSAEKQALKTKDKQAYLEAGKKWEALAQEYSENNFRDKAAYAYYHSAYMYQLNAEHLEKCAALYSVSGLMYNLSNNYDNSLKMWTQSANIYKSLKKHEQAADIFLTTSQIYLDKGDKANAAQSLFQGSESYFLAKKYLQSAKYYKKAGMLYKELENWEMAAKAFSFSARDYENADKNSEATNMNILSAKMFKLARQKPKETPIKKEKPKAMPIKSVSKPKRQERMAGFTFVPIFSFAKKAFPVIIIVVLIISFTVIYFINENYKKPSPLKHSLAMRNANLSDKNKEKTIPLSKLPLPINTVDTTKQVSNKDVKVIKKKSPIKIVEIPTDKEKIIQLAEKKKSKETQPPKPKKTAQTPKIKSPQERYYEQAIADYQEIIRQNPNDDMAYLELGRIYRSKKDYQKAIGYFKSANSINPNNAEVYYYLGLCYKETNKIDSAIKNFTMYLQFRPNVEEVHYELGNLYSLKNRTASAIIAFENVIRLNTDNSDAYRRLGALYETQKMYSESIENYQKAVKLNPNDLQAHIALNWLYNKLGRKEEANTEKQIIQILQNQ